MYNGLAQQHGSFSQANNCSKNTPHTHQCTATG